MNIDQNMIQRYMEFRRNFQGDPRSQIQQMLNSGRISQQQYNDAVRMANQLQNMLSTFAHR